MEMLIPSFSLKVIDRIRGGYRLPPPLVCLHELFLLDSSQIVYVINLLAKIWFVRLRFGECSENRLSKRSNVSHSLAHVLVRWGFFLVNIDEIMFVYCVYSSGCPVLYMTVLHSYCTARIITEMHLIFYNDL